MDELAMTRAPGATTLLRPTEEPLPIRIGSKIMVPLSRVNGRTEDLESKVTLSSSSMRSYSPIFALVLITTPFPTFAPINRRYILEPALLQLNGKNLVASPPTKILVRVVGVTSPLVPTDEDPFARNADEGHDQPGCNAGGGERKKERKVAVEGVCQVDSPSVHKCDPNNASAKRRPKEEREDLNNESDQPCGR